MKQGASVELTIETINGRRLLDLAKLIAFILQVFPNHHVHFAQVIKETVSFFDSQEPLIIFVEFSLVLKLLNTLDLFEAINITVIDILIDVLLQYWQIIFKIIEMILI